MEFDPKTLIDISYFQDRLAAPGRPVEPGLILVGQRNLGPETAIVPLSRAGALKALVKYMVVGLGVYQGLEFLLERGIGDLAGKGGTVASRLYNAIEAGLAGARLPLRAGAEHPAEHRAAPRVPPACRCLTGPRRRGRSG